MIKKIIFLLMLIPLVCMVVLAILSIQVYQRETAKSYSSYQELQQAGVFDQGWLPPFIPQSASIIDLTYNHHSKHVYASFFIVGDDLQSLRDNCQVLLEERKKIIFYCLDRDKELRIRINKQGKAKLEAKPYDELQNKAH